MKLVHSIVQFLLRVPKFPGRDFLIERLPKWFLRKPRSEELVHTRFGFKIKVDPLFDKNIENVIYERGVYELGTVSLIQRLLKEGDVFIDVGANIGFLSMAAAATVGKKGEVLAFEPVPSTYRILAANKELNSMSQLQTFQIGVGSKSEIVSIQTEELNRGGASILNNTGGEEIEIEVKKLDELIASGPISLIKVDVEGYEFEVLKGAEELIKRDQPALIIEYSTDRENSVDSLDMFQWIKELEIYDFYKLKRGKERISSLIKIVSKTGGLPQHDNIICIPLNK